MKPSFETENHTIPSGIRVWNKTNGYLEVSSEGHLLQGQTAAWVEKSPENLSLVEQGLLEIIGMSVDDAPVAQTAPVETPKKKKSSSSAPTVEAPLSSGTEDQVVADDNKKDVEESTKSNNDVSVETV
jgi:hypothetical protein